MTFPKPSPAVQKALDESRAGTYNVTPSGSMISVYDTERKGAYLQISAGGTASDCLFFETKKGLRQAIRALSITLAAWENS